MEVYILYEQIGHGLRSVFNLYAKEEKAEEDRAKYQKLNAMGEYFYEVKKKKVIE